MHLAIIKSLCALLLVAFVTGQDCPASISLEDFRTYTSQFAECVNSDSLNVFQSDVPIIVQLYDLDDNVVPANVQYGDITSYCSSVSACKSAVTSCESSLSNFITEAGMALCANGEALTKAIMEAVDVLKDDSCIEDDSLSSAVNSEGCFLGSGDRYMPDSSPYLEYVTRANKIKSAEHRCLSRYFVKQKVCAADAARALGVITAASEPLEGISTTYDDYTNYATRTYSQDQTTVSVRGMAHLYKDSKRQSTCENLSGSFRLLWNTYIQIDGTMSRLIPTTENMLLTQLVINFADDAGHIIDTYLTTVSSPKLDTQTSQGQAGQSSAVKVQVINENLIVLTHAASVQMKIAVARVRQGLSIHVSLPTDLYNLETVGVLVDGCEAFGGSPVSNLLAGVSDDCERNCSSLEKFSDECAFDCQLTLENHISVYTSVEDQEEAVEWDFSTVSAATRTSSVLSISFIAALLYLISL